MVFGVGSVFWPLGPSSITEKVKVRLPVEDVVFGVKVSMPASMSAAEMNCRA